MTSRIHWIDLAKGGAILLVVLGHVSFLPKPILAGIYSFHMPLFFFLSGLLLFRKKEEFGSFVLKKAKSLICPYYAFLGLQFVVFYGAYKLGFNHARYYLPGFPSLVGLSGVWFLYVLFFIQLLLFPLCRSNGNSKKAVGGGILILAVCVLKADGFTMNVPFEQFRGSTLPLGGDLLFLGGSFVVLGMASRGYLLEKRIPFWFAGACLIVAIVCGVVNYHISGNYQVEFFDHFIGNPFFFYPSAISSIVVIIAICQRSASQVLDADADHSQESAQVECLRSGLHKSIADFCRRISARRWLEWCGSSSLAIYAIHWLFVPFVCAPIFKYLLPLHPSMLFKTACSLLAFLGILAFTLPAAWLVENKMKWMVGR